MDIKKESRTKHDSNLRRFAGVSPGNTPFAQNQKKKKRADTPQCKCALFLIANFFVVRQPPAHSSGLHFEFFRCPPTTGPSVRPVIRIASLSQHCCLSDEVLAHPVSYPIPLQKEYHIVFLNATAKLLRYDGTF